MFKYILVPSTASTADEPALQTALAVARMSAGHICVLDVRPDSAEAIIGLAPAAGPGYDDMIGRIQQKAADRQEEAERAFRIFLRERKSHDRCVSDED